MAQRLRIIKEQIYLDSLAHRRTPESGTAADVVAKAFAYALDGIPTSHLEESFTGAIRAQTDDFPLTAAAVNRFYEELKPELVRQGQQWQPPALPPGQSYITLSQFKERHNLPEDWELGQPYPPESDLSSAPLPGRLEHEQPRYTCLLCKDAGWTRIPYDAKTGRHAKLVRCECNG
jgi:hypothetical protein